MWEVRKKMYKQIIRPTIVLIIISAIVSAMLAITYNVAGIGDLGKGIAQDALDAITVEVMPNATKLILTGTESENPNVYGIYKDEGGKGIAIHLMTKGYGGEMKIIVGLDNNGAITGAKVLESAETPNLGTKVEASDYISQYVGKTGNVAISKDGGDIEAVAGATISSRGFTAGINTAFEVYEAVKGAI